MQKIYLNNTLTRQKEEFVPIKKGEVKIYSCGPTVYNYAHIGNLRSYIFPDLLKKLFRHLDYEVKDVVNITDVGHLVSDGDEGEDKMEKSAKSSGKNIWEIAEYYTESYKEDLKKLNISFPAKFTKATDYIQQQIKLIQDLEKKLYTYSTSDGVYFDTSKFEDYGKMAKLKIEELEKGARVEIGEKKNKTDFALWKFSTEGEKRQMEWQSPWGLGFPGWHLECTAMIFAELGEQIDIHTGGTDHIPVHHTNEIAQAECATDKKYVNYWLHGEFLVLEKNAKMSKSEGNFITLKSLEEKGFSQLAYRYLCLQNHYKSFLTFSFDILKSAETSYKRLKSSIEKLVEKDKNYVVKQPSSYAATFDKEILQALCDDLATPKALVLIRDLIKDEKICSEEKIFLIKKYDEILGLDLLNFSDPKKEEQIPERVKILAKERTKAKKGKNFERADQIRREILELGFEVKDTREGVEIKRTCKN